MRDPKDDEKAKQPENRAEPEERERDKKSRAAADTLDENPHIFRGID